MISKWTGGRVTVCSANGFVCLQLTEGEAIAKLKSRGLNLERAQAVLHRDVSAAEWRATFVQAAAATAVALEESIGRAAKATDVENVRTDLGNAVDKLKADTTADVLRLERRQLEVHLGFEAEKMTRVAMSTGLSDGPDLQAAIWSQLWLSDAGLRLQELREEA